MIRQVLRNFFGKLLYLSVPMGIVYLFLLLALFGLVRALLGDVGALIDGFLALVRSSAEQSGIDLFDFLAYAWAQLDTNVPPPDIWRQILDTSWLQNTLNGFLATLDHSVEDFSGEASTLFAAFSSSVVGHTTAAAALFGVGLCAAGAATRVVLRRKTAGRPPLRALLAAVLMPLLQALLLLGILSLLLLADSRALAAVCLVLLVLLTPFLSLLSAFLLRRDRSVTFRTLVNLRNLCAQLGATAALFGISMAVIALIALLNGLLAILLALPVLIYAMSILAVNADSYAASLSARSAGS